VRWQNRARRLWSSHDGRTRATRAILDVMHDERETRLWHPFADMGAVRTAELVIDRGDDVWVWDAGGRRYLDATAALWYCNVGHGREEIADAVAQQMRRLEAYSAFGDFSNDPARMLADRLAAAAPMRDARVFLGSGGGDGIDTAAKLARRYWVESGEPERDQLFVRTHAYHGTHGYGTSLAGIPANRASWGPLVPDVSVVAWDSVDALRAEVERLGPERAAAVFVEPVIGAGGVYVPPEGYVEGVAALCRETGMLFVCDSVICGFGRLGTWFGIERWGVEPSMVVFAKGVTSGYLPLGGVLVSEQVAEPFWAAPGGPVLRHGPTYSAHATCCAAALANIALLAQDGLLERGRSMEAPLHAALKPFADHDAVAEVRGGVGMLAAVALTDEVLASQPDAVKRIAMAAREDGVLIRPLAGAVAVSPPLTAELEHFELIAAAIDRGLALL
jgi:adenosylmethionine-8-amino-7-oxononanoate aminotransferase